MSSQPSDAPGDSFFKRNGLSIVVLALMAVFLVGQIISGRLVYNAELAELGAPGLSLGAYLTSGHFVAATFENWESEFLQMGMYVLLSVSLRQKGSAESRPLDPAEEQDSVQPGPVPWPVRAGGLWLRLYEHSLALAFSALFLLSFVFHLNGSWRRETITRQLEGEGPISLAGFLGSSEFWFESFQNWQSEFLAVGSLVILSIWLRQKDSPQSKPLRAPHSQTGS
ncbi:hypothetical protein DT603_06130 [Pseudoxanthomonas gei]|uniref:Transmembrane protein n=1 Tax=Pseudoxanthomonas gei TaxID=1383030 RepID=A0ABX0AA56_9GAMM|nr:DUF6766 family protein [Pseudoxanthomonas gei]NDK38420.1 hypothetical protein [Pseudoxanthomonas gei]